MHSILIIEDDTTIAKTYETVFKQEGYSVYTALSGQEGLNSVNQHTIDLILLDMMLPGGMNGFDVLMRLKQDEHTKQIPVIIMTNLESEKQTALDYGAVDYIIKTHVDVKQMLEKIQSFLPQTAS